MTLNWEKQEHFKGNDGPSNVHQFKTLAFGTILSNNELFQSAGSVI